MEEAMIPSLSGGAVGSRFVTEDDIEIAKNRRDEQWKAAYARLGQEPPPAAADEKYDGRSLAEKLAANKAAKQEEFEEKTKLANQFRALEEDEIMFLDSVRERQEEEERSRREKDGEEVQGFREAVAARAVAESAASASIVSPPAPPPAFPRPPKKEVKKGISLKGIVKKKGKPAAVPKPKVVETENPEDELPQAKRRKL